MATITTIAAPALNSSNYGTQLKEVFKNIDDNFKSVAHLPFLRGTQGTNIDISVVGLYEVDPRTGELLVVDSQHPFTVLGKHLVTAIFETTECSTYEQLEAYCASTARFEPLRSGSENTACRNLRFREGEEDENIYITLFSTKTANNDEVTVTEEDTRYLASDGYFAFRDARLRDISMNYDAVTDFIDASCLVVRAYNSEFEQYVFMKTNLLPTLYYSTANDSYCWCINGVETGISANGVQGERGDTANCWFLRSDNNPVQAYPDDNDIYYYAVTPVQWLDASNEIWADITEHTHFSENANTGDLCVVCFKAADGTPNGHHEMAYGILQKEENVYSVVVAQAETFTEYFDIADLELRSELDNIGYNGTRSVTQSHLRGLYIPANDDTTNVHMIYSIGSGNNGGLHIGRVEYTETESNVATPALSGVNELILDNYNISQNDSSNSCSLHTHGITMNYRNIGYIQLGTAYGSRTVNPMPICVYGNTNIQLTPFDSNHNPITNSPAIEIQYKSQNDAIYYHPVNDYDNLQSYINIILPTAIVYPPAGHDPINERAALFVRGGIDDIGNLKVEGHTQLNDTLTVNGATTLNDTLTVNNQLTLNNTGLLCNNSTISSESYMIRGNTINNSVYILNNSGTIYSRSIQRVNSSQSDIYKSLIRISTDRINPDLEYLDLYIVEDYMLDSFIENIQQTTQDRIYYMIGVKPQSQQ